MRKHEEITMEIFERILNQVIAQAIYPAAVTVSG